MIKGPVANAGSMFFLCKIRGISVPKIPAKMITTNNEVEIEKLNRMSLTVK